MTPTTGEGQDLPTDDRPFFGGAFHFRLLSLLWRLLDTAHRELGSGRIEAKSAKEKSYAP